MALRTYAALAPSRFGVLCLAAVTLIAPHASAVDVLASGQMTPAERTYLLEELTSSRDAFLASVRDLTAEQWTFTPAADRWSAQQCAEHIILAEDAIRADAERMLHTPAAPRLADATATGDRALVAQVLDRTRKAKAPAALIPTEQFATPASAIAAFVERRDREIRFVQSTTDALRAHSGEGPTGAISDVYQVLLIMAAHSARHTAQIRETEADPHFPPAHAATGL